MTDYINYIDSKALKLAELAYQIGDNQLAIENYSLVLIKLRNYQGDRMQPALIAKDILEKINKLKEITTTKKKILNTSLWQLSKSSFVKGIQCEKYLYLDKYKKNQKTPISIEKQNLFNQGHDFEDTFRNKEFPNGSNIKDIVGNFQYFQSYTEYLLQQNHNQIIYEATIIEDEVLVMCDVLVKQESGFIDIYEIKLNKEVNEAILNDLTIQYYICKKRFKNKLNSFNLVLNSDNYQDWKIFDFTSDLEKRSLRIPTKINKFKQILSGSEPEINIGSQCTQPYECDFMDYCKSLTQNK